MCSSISCGHAAQRRMPTGRTLHMLAACRWPTFCRACIKCDFGYFTMAQSDELAAPGLLQLVARCPDSRYSRSVRVAGRGNDACKSARNWIFLVSAEPIVNSRKCEKCYKEVLSAFDVGLRTDVTGFGLLGHLQSSLPSGLGAKLDVDALPLLPGALTAYRAGVRPTILNANQQVTRPMLHAEPTADVSALIHDPQTSGGLLFSLSSKHAQAAISALVDAGYSHSCVIGMVTNDGVLEVAGSWA